MVIVLGILIGVIVGLLLPFTYNTAYSLYISVVILASFDSLLGGANAAMRKTFDTGIFLSGLFGNTAIAVMLTYFGERVGVPMYYATIVVFGGRIFNNFAEIRRILLKKIHL